MSKLMPGDLIVAPAYLMRGLKPIEQVIVLYVWERVMTGKEWTMTSLATDCGGTVVRARLEALVEGGVLVRTAETGRKNLKPCHEYEVKCEHVPEREPVKEPVKKAKAEFPIWVFKACKIWKKHGLIYPQPTFSTLKIAVQDKGELVVLAAFERYAETADKKFNPAPWKFVQHIEQYIGATPKPSENRSLADLG